jgi:hypothetical protein
MINFRLFYPQARYNIHWHLGLMFIANSALADSERDPEWQFYFMACLYGYGALYPAYRLAELCVRGLLTIAMEKKRMRPAHAQSFLKELSRRGEHHRTAKVYSGMRLDLDTDHSKGKLETVEDLSAKFELTALLNTDEKDDIIGDVANGDKMFDEFINLDEIGLAKVAADDDVQD